jgi:hypothetical protein
MTSVDAMANPQGPYAYLDSTGLVSNQVIAAPHG